MASCSCLDTPSSLLISCWNNGPFLLYKTEEEVLHGWSGVTVSYNLGLPRCLPDGEKRCWTCKSTGHVCWKNSIPSPDLWSVCTLQVSWCWTSGVTLSIYLYSEYVCRWNIKAWSEELKLIGFCIDFYRNCSWGINAWFELGARIMYHHLVKKILNMCNNIIFST